MTACIETSKKNKIGDRLLEYTSWNIVVIVRMIAAKDSATPESSDFFHPEIQRLWCKQVTLA